MTARPAFHDHYTSAGLAAASSLRVSPDAALLDRLWRQAHEDREEPVLDTAALAGFAPEKRAAVVLYPHAAARWAWFANGAAALDWGQDHRRAHVGSGTAHSTGILITRLGGAVQWQPLDAVSHAFLSLFADGGIMAQAEAAARAASADTDNARIAQLAVTLAAAGAFSRMSVTRMARRTRMALPRRWNFSVNKIHLKTIT